MIHKPVKICKFWFIFCLFSILSSYPKSLRPLKILFVVNSFPPNSGTAVLNQITGLIDRDLDVYIYAKRKGDVDWAHPDMIHYALLDRTYFNNKQYNNLPVDLDTFDIIYCQFGHRGKEFVEIKKKLGLKAKLVTCFRGADISKYLKKNLHAYDKLFETGDLFLPVCDFFKQKLLNLGCPKEKIIVHHSAIDCTKFFYRPRYWNIEEPIRIVSVCRLVEKKGLEYSIRAVAKLLKKYPNIEYQIVGFGPLMSELVCLIKKLGVQNNNTLIGHATKGFADKMATERMKATGQPVYVNQPGAPPSPGQVSPKSVRTETPPPAPDHPGPAQPETTITEPPPTPDIELPAQPVSSPESIQPPSPDEDIVNTFASQNTSKGFKGETSP